jgi:hypothetical protein
MESIFKVCSCNWKEWLVGLSLLFYGVCVCKGIAQPNTEKDAVTTKSASADLGGRTSPVTAGAEATERTISVSPLPSATFSGVPGERVVVGGEEKRIWSTAPRGAITPSPVPTYRVYPYVMLPSDKTR